MPRGIKVVDPLKLKASIPKDMIFFASGQLQGKRVRQEDSIRNFSTECFAIADGVGGMKHGDIAARLTTETAIWGYKHIRLRPFYWADKKLFIKRIFRSVNITVWQKQREIGFSYGMASTLVVLMVGSRTIWLGSVGDSSALFLHNNIVTALVKPDRSSDGSISKAIGVARYGLVPQFATRPFELGDSVAIVTDGISDVLTPEEIAEFFFGASTQVALEDGIKNLLEAAQEKGSTDNMTACIVSRVAVDRANRG